MTPQLKSGRQFSVRVLFWLTTVLAIFYGCLNWFGVMAHVAVWGSFLTVGPLLGIVVGIKWLKEDDAIVNGVQAGAMGGVGGFVGALLLLAPSYTEVSFDDVLFVALFGSQAAFIAGGVMGFGFGIVRAFVAGIVKR